MRLRVDPVPIADDDVTIRAALEDVDVVPLLVTVAYATGDLSVLREDLRPNPLLMLEPNAGLSAGKIAEGRDVAAAALGRWRDDGCPPPPEPTDEDVHAMLDHLAGGTLSEHYVPVLREELALGGEDLRAPSWRKADVAPDRTFRVVVVGAGLSGIVVAHRLQQAGVDFTVVEKNADVGGTWLENVYPGCRVDVQSHFYCFSFAQTPEWPQLFSTQDVLLDYFRSCVDQLGLRQHIRFESEVESIAWDEDAQRWRVLVRAPDGLETLDADAVVSAVGQLNRPSLPEIPGRERYAGTWFHSARWDHAVDLTEQRVAIIGTGASAAQFIPWVAERASSLTVFQRTPPWLLPTPNYHDDVAPGLRWLLRHVPAFANWDRVWLFWRTQEGLLPMAQVDDQWRDNPEAVSPLNEFVRQLFSQYLVEQFPDPDLYAKVQPRYPPLSKRFVRDNGIWARTLARPNVSLVTDRIAEITEKGVRTADGLEHEVDVIVYGTGFTASEFLTPMTVKGRDGRDLHETWGGDARAYLGITIPYFPNLFLMYGPNTNIVVNGSIIFFSECEAHYIVESIRMLLERGLHAMDCRPEVHDAYNQRIDEDNRKRAWGASSVNSWYKNARGRVTQNWPYALLDYWEQTRAPDPDDYVLT